MCLRRLSYSGVVPHACTGPCWNPWHCLSLTAFFDVFKLGMLLTAIYQFNVNSGERRAPGLRYGLKVGLRLARLERAPASEAGCAADSTRRRRVHCQAARSSHRSPLGFARCHVSTPPLAPQRTQLPSPPGPPCSRLPGCGEGPGGRVVGAVHGGQGGGGGENAAGGGRPQPHVRPAQGGRAYPLSSLFTRASMICVPPGSGGPGCRVRGGKAGATGCSAGACRCLFAATFSAGSRAGAAQAAATSAGASRPVRACLTFMHKPAVHSAPALFFESGFCRALPAAAAGGGRQGRHAAGPGRLPHPGESVPPVRL